MTDGIIGPGELAGSVRSLDEVQETAARTGDGTFRDQLLGKDLAAAAQALEDAASVTPAQPVEPTRC